MDEPTPEQPQPMTFDQAEQVAAIELDRYCANCGYNLHQQPIRREPTTGLLLCKCPECGAFEPANQATTRPKSWFGQLVLLLWLAWIAALGGALAGGVGAFTQLSYELGELLNETKYLDEPIPDPRDTSENSVRTINFQYELDQLDGDRLAEVSLRVGAAFVIGTGIMALFVLFVPHWPRNNYLLLALGWPMVGLLGFYGTKVVDNYTLDYATYGLTMWILLSPMLIFLFAVAGGLTAVCLGRAAARFIARIVIPPRHRGPFAYLWLVDDKKQPGTQSQPSRSTP